jgi:O-antigen ligase
LPLFNFFFYEISFLNIQRIDSKRVSSFFGDEKILGGYLLRLLPLILYLIFKINLDIKLGVLILITILLGIIISGERTSVILSTIMLSLLFFLNFDIKKKITFSSILILFVLLLFFLNGKLYERLIFETYNDIFNSSNKISSFNIFSIGHTYYYITSIKMFFDNPIFGIGPNLFRLLCSNPEYGLGTDINNCSTHPHNYYLQLLAETGVLGFIFLFSLFTWTSINIFKHIFKIKLVETYKYCLLISVFINIFPISSHGNFFNNWNSMIIFFSLPFLLKEFNLISFKK